MAAENEKGKKKNRDTFDEYVEKHWAPGPNTDYLDPFSLMGLMVYGALKLVSKTRQRYRKWKERDREIKLVNQKMDKIRYSRVRNSQKAKSLDEMLPDVRENARKMAKDLIKSKSPVVNGRDAETLAFDIGKNLQEWEDTKNEQNAWVGRWQQDVEKELREEILEGKKPDNPRQFSQAYAAYINSPEWLEQKVNERSRQYVTELVRDDPSLKGKEDDLMKRVRAGAYEQALVDRNVYNGLYTWQNEMREKLLNEVLEKERSGKKNPVVNEAEKKNPEVNEAEKKNPEVNEVEKKNPEAGEAGKKADDLKNAPQNNKKEEALNKKAPEAVRNKAPQKMPRWISGRYLEIMLQSDLKPAPDKPESKEFKEFRESMEKLARSSNDKTKDRELLSSEYVDAYNKAKAYISSEKRENEPEGRTKTAEYVVSTLDYNKRIEKYNLLKDRDLDKIQDLDQAIADLRSPLEKSKETIEKEKAQHKLEKERQREKNKDRSKEREEEMVIGG